MTVYIPKGSNIFLSKEILTENCYSAFYGFAIMGWHIEFYEKEVPKDLTRNDVVVGFITDVKKALKNLEIEPPLELDYPESIQSYLGRKIWKSTLHKIYTSPETYPVFVKPVLGKQFTGKLITGLADMIGIGAQEDREVWCSEPVDFVSEYRCFVKYGQLIDVRKYKGDYNKYPNINIVKSCIEDYKEQPAALSFDFGVTSDDRTLLVEVNDGFALGNYGLDALNYAKIISARWHQMVDLPDPCQF